MNKNDFDGLIFHLRDVGKVEDAERVAELEQRYKKQKKAYLVAISHWGFETDPIETIAHLEGVVDELRAKLAAVEKEKERLKDAHQKNADQHRPAFTLRDKTDMTHVCVWRQRFEAVQARSEAALEEKGDE